VKEKIEEELNRLTNSGVISRVQTSEWATPTVPVKKPNGSVCLYGDYKVTINPYLNVNPAVSSPMARRTLLCS